uniref:Uncharacterized protein n=1 Tax=Timema cristinae TaxID=61476 RepID=A0A7R9CK26_TIMCR|nr:unnamed protein product [Timema cristinae]
MRKSQQRGRGGTGEDPGNVCHGGSELVTDSNENMICGAAQAVERVVGEACASVEKRRKGRTMRHNMTIK